MENSILKVPGLKFEIQTGKIRNYNLYKIRKWFFSHSSDACGQIWTVLSGNESYESPGAF